MKIYQFTTKISQSGTIQLPVNFGFFDKEVEVTIRSKNSEEKRKKSKAMDFVNEWSGFSKNPNTEDIKFNYLSDKYK